MHTFLLMALLGLSGFVTREAVLEIPEYKMEYENRQLNMDALQGVNAEGVSVMVVFGDWCGDSLDHVPPFMCIQDVLAFADVQWVAVGRKLADDTGVVESFGIERVPTFLFFVNGEEIGRIIETPAVSMEQDVADILVAAETTEP